LLEQIKFLASLQIVDQEIREKEGTKRMHLAQIELREMEIEAKRAELGILKVEWEEQDKIRKEKEQALQEESRKTVEKRMRMNRIKNIKELQALDAPLS